MSVKIIRIVRLTFIEGTSSKEYTAVLLQNEKSLHDVWGMYGRIGGTLKLANKTGGNSLGSASAAYTELISSKRLKGYREDECSASTISLFRKLYVDETGVTIATDTANLVQEAPVRYVKKVPYFKKPVVRKNAFKSKMAEGPKMVVEKVNPNLPPPKPAVGRKFFFDD